MSGHSKWATIKHRKGLADAKRGKLFSKLAKEITIASRLGGGDLNANPRLRTAVTTARSSSMPSKNIENAIKKGTGESKEGVDYTEISYEGYGPHGVAVMVECLTDNKNRTVAELRTLFSKNNGSLGETGSVSWQFDKKGVIHIEKERVEEDKITELALELSAEDIRIETEGYVIYTTVDSFHEINESLQTQEVPIANAEITLVPKNTVSITAEQTETINRFIEVLEDHEDVKSVSSNEENP